MSQGTVSVSEANSPVEAEVAIDPDFIVYLLDPLQEYNCYFVVGNPDVGDTERIGVVKKMLLAHSLVLRAELQDSKIAEKNDVKVTDVFPRTFKNLLRFVYGYDNTEGLSFDEADNLLYAAEKYIMPKLKNRLATRLMSMLNCSNICNLMNNPACYTVLELNSAITEILQLETEQVLASPQFLDLSPYGFLQILEQEVSNVTEIELWRTAIEWAKNRSGESENAQVLRTELNDHLQHIRICSMSSEDLFTEVMPAKVLTYDELILVGKSRRTGEVQPSLTTICNVIEERDRPVVKSELLNQSFIGNGPNYGGSFTESTFKLKTKDAAIELCSVQLCSYNMSSHQCNCTISVQRDTEPPIVARFEGQVNSASDWAIPILVDDKNVQLSPNSSYLIKFTFSCSAAHYCGYHSSRSYGVSGSHFSVDFQTRSNGYYIFHFNAIGYKTITKRVKSVQTVQ